METATDIEVVKSYLTLYLCQESLINIKWWEHTGHIDVIRNKAFIVYNTDVW